MKSALPPSIYKFNRVESHMAAQKIAKAWLDAQLKRAKRSMSDVQRARIVHSIKTMKATTIKVEKKENEGNCK